MSLKRTDNPDNENIPSPDLGPEIDIPVDLQYSSRQFWRPKPVLFIHENGFRLQDGRQETTILYSEIERVAWSESDRYINGILSGTFYDMVLGLRSGKLRIKHLASVEVGDSFPTFVKNVLIRAADSIQGKLDLGGNVQGEGWTLTKEALSTNAGTIGLKEIADVDVLEEFVTVWQRQKTYPVFRVAAASPEARILVELLERHLKEHPPEESSDSLGRFLYRRQAHGTLRILILAAAVGLLALGLWLLFQSDRGLLPAFLCLLLSAFAGVSSFFLLRRVYDFHQSGVIQRPGYRVMLFKNCESLQYQVSAQYVNGVYGFTRITMRLKATSPATVMQIRTQCYGNDKELEQTKTNLAKSISDRMYERVSAGGEVLWGSSVRIGKKDIHYLTTRLIGGTTRGMVSLTQPLAYTIDSGKFGLFRVGEMVPLFTMDCEEENFYPGYFLLLRLVAEHQNSTVNL